MWNISLKKLKKNTPNVLNLV